MKCAACGYDDSKMTKFKDGVLTGLTGCASFIPITINYEKQVIDACHTRFHWQTLYACPNCGTVKMEVK